ncbi:MAG: universal stress protein [Acetilactobacillus jinshanensis]
MTENYQQILVPIDGSKNAKLAFKRALSVAKNNHAHLHLVNVIDTRTFDNISSIDESTIDKLTSKTKKTLDQYQASAQKQGLNDYSIEFGSPKTIISHQMTKRWHIDLIIMGANGLTTVERVLIGSVAAYVSHAAPCDTLLVRK